MNVPLLSSRSRVMLFAPHPDDESLATGVFLQRAVAAGAEVRVVYATDGERNCWPQRLLEGKVRIGESDRRRWGVRRQAEALAALALLGIGRDCVEFLSLPDQGVTDLLLAGCGATLRRLANVIAAWEPTHLLMPSALDTHPDHSGLAILLGLVVEHHLPAGENRMTQLHYLVHGSSQAFAREAHEMFSSALETKLKRRAIVSHVTQVAFSRRRFLGYARRPERFVVGGRNRASACDGPIRSFFRSPRELRLQVEFRVKPLRCESASLYLVGHDSLGNLRRLRLTLPGRSAKIDLIDCTTGAIASVGRYEGDAFGAEIVLPLHGFDASRAVFVKLDRRVWFFDEAGWIEIAAPVHHAATFRPAAAPVRELAVA